MKKLYILAALFMATSSAQAGGNGISFEIQGQRIYVEAMRNCDSLSCIKISAPGLSGSSFGNFKGKSNNNDNDDYADRKDTQSNSGSGKYKDDKSNRYNDDKDYADRNDTPSAPLSSSAPAQANSGSGYGKYNGYRSKRFNNNDYANDRNDTPAAAAQQPAAPAAPTVASNTPTANDYAPQAAAPAAAPAPQRAPVAAAPEFDPNSPVGIWVTEEGKGNVQIEPCGANLCGFAVKSGEKILINMKPSGSKWTGRIHDPDSGRNYDSTIALKGTNSLRVQGCAFGGMFCGGQTWKRLS